MSFVFENPATRESLKNAFESLFAKYGRSFDDDDEIDLVNLKIIKRGNHLTKIKALRFGETFKGTGLKTSSNPPEHETSEAYDDVFVRLSTQVQSQTRSILKPSKDELVSTA